MKKKLIIFIPHIRGGGVEKNFFIISNYLAKRIEKISVITINKEYKNKLSKNINLISPKSSKWKYSGIYTKYIISIYLLIKTLLTEKKCLVLSFQANWYAILVVKFFGSKIITRSNTAPEGWSNNTIKKFFYKIILKLADQIIVNSKEFKRNMFYKFGIKTTLIYNPLNHKQIIKLSKKKFKFPFFKNKKYFKIINIGRFTDQKNQILILKAFKNLKEKFKLKLVIAGRGPNKNLLTNYVKDNKLNKSAKIINFLNNPYPLMKMSNVFILSSNFEGLPNVLLEAQTLKLPIISTDCPTGPKEILQNGKLGQFIRVKNQKDLENKIIFSVKNKKYLNNTAIEGYKYLFRFNENTNLNKYYNVIKKYLN
tara:strand:- start:63 stop:1163 length:1101 start_codon:yes stop_codon:yes gene_type:complete